MTLEHAMEIFLEQLATEAWRKPAARDPALCVKGIPLPQHLQKAGSQGRCQGKGSKASEEERKVETASRVDRRPGSKPDQKQNFIK